MIPFRGVGRAQRIGGWCAVVVALVAGTLRAEPRQLCIYVGRDGSVHQVNSRIAVPADARETARCFDEAMRGESRPERSVDAPISPTESRPIRAGEQLVSPGEFDLGGAVRRVNMASPLGRIELRWSRAIEELFGRTPERALAEAARTVSRVLRSGPFPARVRALDVPWSVVFMEAAEPDGQIPAALVGNCHPGWMTPPANIYIVAERVASGCRETRQANDVADETLAEVLIHEMGHAVEYALLGREFGRERARAEGFATWFTGYAARSSPLLAGSGVAEKYRRTARAAKGPVAGSRFGGSAEDYARAAMIFEAIVARRGVRGVVMIYDVMVQDSLELLPAVERVFGWDEAQLASEVRRVLETK